MWYNNLVANTTQFMNLHSITLNIKKISRGYYTNTYGSMTITVSNSATVIGGKSQWQITIIDGNEIELSAFANTKAECCMIGVKHLTK